MSASTHDRLSLDVRTRLAAATGTDAADWHLLSKGRHALELVLAQLEPGEVLTQPFTCLTAVAPAITAGHVPTYADIDLSTLALDPAGVGRGVGGRTRAVVGQHTFGAVAPLAELRAELDDDVLLVEDAAHCLGEMAVDGSGRPVADVSVHSFGVEKMLPTRAGAALWVDPAAAGRPWHTRLTAALAGLSGTGVRGAVSEVVSPTALRVGRRLGGPAARMVDRAAAAGLVDKAIMPSELSGVVAGTPAALTGRSLAAVARELPALAASRRHRRRIAAIYREGLAGLSDLTRPAALDEAGRSLVRYPLLLATAEQAEAAFAALSARGLVPGRWYRPLLFPGPADPAPFAYAPGSCPVAEDAAARILNLQTAPFVTEEAALAAVDVVRSQVG